MADQTQVTDLLVSAGICEYVSFPAETHTPPYDRTKFGTGWEQGVVGCMNKRMALLKDTSAVRVRTANSGCSVVQGRWRDPYTNSVHTDAQTLDIDHIVPLSFAWHRGAARWSADKRERFANDTRNLVAVPSSVNRSKRDKSPLEWLPPNRRYHCEYIREFSAIMNLYGLTWLGGEERRFAAIRKQACG